MSKGGSEQRYRASQALKEEIERELDDIEKRIARLRVLYDQYFMGIEKVEPLLKRTELAKVLRRSQVPKRGTTVLKFRFRSLQQRFTSYCSYWDRIVRMIEEGRIRRGVATPLGDGSTAPRVGDGQQRFAPAQSLASKKRRFRVREKEESAEVGAGRKAPPVRTFGGVDIDLNRDEFEAGETDLIYRRLVQERQRAGEATDKLNRSVVEKSIGRILGSVGDKDVRFRITTRDGKVSLTAVLKKSKD